MAELPLVRRLAYSVGHVFNDLCASMWFTYLLVYYHRVLNFNNIMAGNILLIGQVSDALATPFVGLESDRLSGFCSYGKRKSWHLLGSICVLISFVFIFMPSLGRNGYVADDWAQLIYYVPFVVVFQFGWAAVQISHLALIPDLSSCERVRLGLNASRYAFTVLSNVAVYGIAWILLHITTSHSDDSDLSPDDTSLFRELALIVTGMGAVFAFIFHIGTKEPNRSVDVVRTTTLSINNSTTSIMRTGDWLRTSQFYLMGIVYMLTRLIVNLSQVYLSMYLLETLELSKTYIAIVPLVVYLSGFLSSFVAKPLNVRFGRKVAYVVGLAFVAGASVWYYFLKKATQTDQYYVIAASALGGIGSSTILITSLAMTADLIGENSESGAFVYGAMSFVDKLANGIAVQVIQVLHPCRDEACCAECEPFYRIVIVFVPGGLAVIAFFFCLLLRKRESRGTLLSSQIVPQSESKPLLNDSAAGKYSEERQPSRQAALKYSEPGQTA